MRRGSNDLEAVRLEPRSHVKQVAQSRDFNEEETEEVEVPDVAEHPITGKKVASSTADRYRKEHLSSHVSNRVHN